MKRVLVCLLSALLVVIASACNFSGTGTSSSGTSSSSQASGSSPVAPSNTGWRDGTYRGAYVDGGDNQVSVQFTLENNVITEISYRSLTYKGVNYLAEDADETTKKLAAQHKQLIDYLVGKNVTDGFDELYYPEKIADDADSFTAATMRSGKVISALNDALNRGPYSIKK